MALKVHHLRCATFCPIGARWLRTDGAQPAELVCHCLLVETPSGLVLVDAGLGLADAEAPAARLGRSFVNVVRPRDIATTAAARAVERLGFARDDVRHIVLTHLDLDHAGGISDFPDARVHVLKDELDAATARRTLPERERYRPIQWEHGPKWETYTADGGAFFGFEAVRALRGLPPELLLVPLVGHSRGHAGVAVDTGAGWLLHAGDAYFHRDELLAPPACPPLLAMFQRLVAVDDAQRRHNQARLRELHAAHGDAVRVFSAHDAAELRAFAPHA